MLNDLSVARLAFRQGRTAADALLTTAKVQVQLDNATAEGKGNGAAEKAQAAVLSRLTARAVDKMA